MDELEVLYKAKSYIDKLANGINPLTDQPVGENDVVNNVKLSRCFFYVSDVLRQVIENGGRVYRARRKRKFQITDLQLSGFEYSDTPIPMREIVDRLNKLIDQNEFKKISSMALNGWLRGIGLFKETSGEFGKLKFAPSELGEEIGIQVQRKIGSTGEYFGVFYNRNAQEFILNNIQAFLEERNKR